MTDPEASFIDDDEMQLGFIKFLIFVIIAVFAVGIQSRGGKLKASSNAENTEDPIELPKASPAHKGTLIAVIIYLIVLFLIGFTRFCASDWMYQRVADTECYYSSWGDPSTWIFPVLRFLFNNCTRFIAFKETASHRIGEGLKSSISLLFPNRSLGSDLGSDVRISSLSLFAFLGRHDAVSRLASMAIIIWALTYASKLLQDSQGWWQQLMMMIGLDSDINVAMRQRQRPIFVDRIFSALRISVMTMGILFMLCTIVFVGWVIIANIFLSSDDPQEHVEPSKKHFELIVRAVFRYAGEPKFGEENGVLDVWWLLLAAAILSIVLTLIFDGVQKMITPEFTNEDQPTFPKDDDLWKRRKGIINTTYSFMVMSAITLLLLRGVFFTND